MTNDEQITIECNLIKTNKLLNEDVYLQYITTDQLWNYEKD